MKFKELEPLQSGANVPRIKLSDGQSVKGVFRGEPYDFYKHWIGGRTVVCPGRDKGCEHCKAGEKFSFRFTINFVTKEGDQFVAKVFEGGRPTYLDLAELSREYDLKTHIVKIGRKGSGADTRYTIIPQADGKLQPAALQKIEAVKLVDLAPQAKPAPDPQEPGQDDDDDWGDRNPDMSEADVPF